jgi:multidrug efflux pump
MNFSFFFIRRPIFAGVLSVIILLVGLMSLSLLPVSEYPEVAPPNIVVTAMYPGANPKTLAETVASPIEQALNGVERSLYISSQSTTDGMVTITVTFKLGTDLDKAQVAVQNRVNLALPKLPEEARRIGITTLKSSPDLTMVVHLTSPRGTYDDIFVRNYATLQVKDLLARVPGVGQVAVFGSGDYCMRLWLDPEKMAARGLAPSDIIGAVSQQNAQVAAGAVGQQPLAGAGGYEYSINTNGRLIDEKEFENIVVKTGTFGETILLKDVARVTLGASTYSLRSLLNNKSAVALPVFQQPGSNAIQLAKDIRAKMDELKRSFPPDLDYSVVYDTTVFVNKSIEAVIHTLLEAIVLVVLVVLVFLQTWRASIIPLAAVPVSLIGTLAVLHGLGFSINTLSLFGLVLAIGIVVDDAIVVVENVERNIANGLNPYEATRQAMKEVTGPIIATALVLCAVFIPTAFITGLTGQFYKQFALTIAISTVISAFNSLTLSPALAALLLRRHDAPKDWFSKLINALFGWFFRPFNRFFELMANFYSRTVAIILRRAIIALGLYFVLLFYTYKVFDATPTGFVPAQDKQYLIGFAQLPDASSIDKTDAVMRKMGDIMLSTPGVQSAVQFPGLSIAGFSNATNYGVVFATLAPFEDRTTPELSGAALAQTLNMKFASIQEARTAVFTPPQVNGLGATGGFKMQIEDRSNLGYTALAAATEEILNKARTTPGLDPFSTYSSFNVNVPQIEADIDVEKCASLGVSKQDVSQVMQVFLGSLYINDFNRFGRTFQVVAQADAQFRSKPDDILRLKVRNRTGQMVPLGSVMKIHEAAGADRAMHYNGYLSADINSGPAPGFTANQAESILEGVVKETLPKGMGYEWTELTYQRILAGNSAVYIFPLCILLVFLVLAAQYESLRLPLAIVLIVPLCVLFALLGVMIDKGENNVFTQIGLIVLMGLACKNAILIVEFAKMKHEEEGLSHYQAALEACRLRLRPILMTSIAFIAGVWPLVASTGAGSEMRHSMGVAVFSGMIGVTVLGLIFTPVFYLLVMRGKKDQATEEIKAL